MFTALRTSVHVQHVCMQTCECALCVTAHVAIVCVCLFIVCVCACMFATVYLCNCVYRGVCLYIVSIGMCVCASHPFVCVHLQQFPISLVCGG